MSSTEPELTMVPIADVFWDAQRVPFDHVNAGDSVFDAYGGRHKITGARVLKSGALSIAREDLRYREHIYPDSKGDRTITITRAHGWSETGQRYRTWADPITGVTVGAFYETCRCGQVFEQGPDDDGSGARLLLADHANQTNGYEEF